MGCGGFSRPEDFLPLVELEQEGIANFRRVERFCEAVDEVIQAYCPPAKRLDVHPATDDFFAMKMLFDALYFRTVQLAEILDAEKPSEIFCFPIAIPDLAKAMWSAEASFYPQILSILAAGKGIKCTRIDSALNGAATPVARRGPVGWRRITRALRRRASGLLDRATTRHISGRRGTVLLIDDNYNLSSIAGDLHRMGFEVWMWEEGCGPRRWWLPRAFAGCSHLVPKFGSCDFSNIRRRISEIPEISELWSWRGHKLWPIAERRLDWVLGQGLKDALLYSRWSELVFSRVRPDVLLASGLIGSRSQSIARIARKSGIPVLVSHHGGMGHAHMPMLLYQNRPADGYLCYGKGTAVYFRKYCSPSPWTGVSGAPMIDRGVREAPGRKQIRRELGLEQNSAVVLYILSNFPGSQYYFSHHAKSDSGYFRIQRRITNVLGAHPEYQVVIKGHVATACDPLRRIILKRGWSHIKSMKSPPFQELVNLADAVIIDAPATTILQALHADCNLYVFNDWFQWEPGAREALEECCFFSEDLDRFCARLEYDLATGQIVQSHPRTSEYLDLFCFSDTRIHAGRMFAESVAQFLQDSSTAQSIGQDGR